MSFAATTCKTGEAHPQWDDRIQTVIPAFLDGNFSGEAPQSSAYGDWPDSAIFIEERQEFRSVERLQGKLR